MASWIYSSLNCDFHRSHRRLVCGGISISITRSQQPGRHAPDQPSDRTAPPGECPIQLLPTQRFSHHGTSTVFMFSLLPVSVAPPPVRRARLCGAAQQFLVTFQPYVGGLLASGPGDPESESIIAARRLLAVAVYGLGHAAGCRITNVRCISIYNSGERRGAIRGAPIPITA